MRLQIVAAGSGWTIGRIGARICKPLQIGTAAVFFARAACQHLKAEDAAQQASESRSCARSTFRVLVDVGHTATSPGADSAREAKAGLREC